MQCPAKNQHLLCFTAAAALLLVNVAPAAAIRQLQQSNNRALPPLDKLQGAWDGKRTTGALILWDEDDRIFDADCMRNEERMVHAAFDKGGYNIDYKKGLLEYEASMQILSTFGERQLI